MKKLQFNCIDIKENYKTTCHIQNYLELNILMSDDINLLVHSFQIYLWFNKKNFRLLP